MTRFLRLSTNSCPHDLFGTFRLTSEGVTFVPSELTMAFRDGDELTVAGLELADRGLALAVHGIARDLKTIETPDGRTIDRHPDFTVILEPAPGFTVHPIASRLYPTT